MLNWLESMRAFRREGPRLPPAWTVSMNIRYGRLGDTHAGESDVLDCWCHGLYVVAILCFFLSSNTRSLNESSSWLQVPSYEL